VGVPCLANWTALAAHVHSRSAQLLLLLLVHWYMAVVYAAYGKGLPGDSPSMKTVQDQKVKGQGHKIT